MTVNRGEYNFNFYNVIRYTINGSRESYLFRKQTMTWGPQHSTASGRWYVTKEGGLGKVYRWPRFCSGQLPVSGPRKSKSWNCLRWDAGHKVRSTRFPRHHQVLWLGKPSAHPFSFFKHQLHAIHRCYRVLDWSSQLWYSWWTVMRISFYQLRWWGFWYRCWVACALRESCMHKC